MKFRSCMTLFEAAAPPPVHATFAEALRKYFDGVADARTLELLRHRIRHPRRSGFSRELLISTRQARG